MLRKIKLAKKYLLSPKPFDGPIEQEDFKMHSEIVDVKAYTRRLQEAGFDNIVIAHATYKNISYPVLQMNIGKETAPKRMLLLGGVHGNEFAAALAIEDIVNRLKVNPELYKHWAIQIITPINPIGLALNSRYNEDGYDINRDFKDFNTVGARMQKQALEAFKPSIVITLHESPQDGFFMFSEGKLPKGMRDAITHTFIDEGIPLASKNYFGVKTKSGIWEKPRLVFTVQKLLGMNTLGSYVHKLGIPAITTESTWSDKNVENRKKPHVAAVLAVLKNWNEL